MLEWLIQHTVESAALAAVVWLLSSCFRRRPAVRHALWLLVLVKLLTPPLVRWPWPLPAWPAPEAVAVAPTPPPAESHPPAAPPPAADAPAIEETVDPAPSIVAAPAPAEKPATPPDGSWLLGAAGWVWAAGAGVAALVQMTRLVRLRRLLRRGLPAPEWLRELTAEAAAALKMRPPRALVLAGAASPMVCALGAPRLLWPLGLEDRLSAEGRRAVLIHELAHLRRRDHWVGWLLLAAGCVWWWHPLFWWVRRRLTQEAELACDARVVDALPEARKAYAEALLEVSKRPSAAPAPVLGASSGRRDLERRLVMVMRGKGPGRLSWGGLIAVGVLGLLALPAWSLGQGQAPKPPEPPKGPIYYEPVTTVRPVTTYQAVTTYQLRNADAAATPPAPEPQAARDQRLKELDEKVQQLLKEMQDLRGQAPPPVPPVPIAPTDFAAPASMAPPGLPVPDPPDAQRPYEVALSRVIYKLPAGHAEATASFLRDHVGASVLETKADGDNLIVTTTPETQKVIRMLIALVVQSKPVVAPPPTPAVSDGPGPASISLPPSSQGGPGVAPPPAADPLPPVSPPAPSTTPPPAAGPEKR